MTCELRSISPSRLARVLAAVFGTFFLIVALLAIPMFLLSPYPEYEHEFPPKYFLLVALVRYPVFGAIWGWIAGQVTARIYNFAARKIGGVTLELAQPGTKDE